jgi:hypothetical protein
VIKKETREDMIEFLLSDESLNVFSNSQELLAIANLYNIKINIFTYGQGIPRWTEVGPDASMQSTAEVSSGIVPDLFLYHSHDCHYDLLIKEDSRIVTHGFSAGSSGEHSANNKKTRTKNVGELDGIKVTAKDCKADGKNETKCETKEKDDFEWKKVPIKKRKIRSELNASTDEQLLVDNPILIAGEAKDDLAEETTLLGAKQSGHRRTGPHESPLDVQTKTVFKCDECDADLEAKGLLEAHKKTHEPQFCCDSCSEQFELKDDLDEHINVQHKKRVLDDEWNCNDCPFQSTNSSHLMKHLKLTTHQPSHKIKERKSLFLDYKQCFTCKLEFGGYWNLMNHRKTAHPSNKLCRNFPQNLCTFGSDCWYVHKEK